MQKPEPKSQQLSKIGNRYKIAGVNKAFSDAEAVVYFINKNKLTLEGLECLPDYYRAKIK